VSRKAKREIEMAWKVRSAAFALAIATAGVSAATTATAQPMPQTITIVVAAAAGGFADGVARVIGEQIAERLHVKVVIENKGGAGGNLGARYVAQSTPDGATVLVSTTAMAINPTLYKNMGYAAADLTPVVIAGSAPEAFVVHPSNPAKTLKEFIANAKGKPIEYASAGVGTGSYIAAEYMFKVLAKVQTVHVPFPGGAPAITAVLGNHVAALAATVSPLIVHINSGKLRGIGIASAQRFPAVPEVPTYIENGFTGFTAASWVGFFVPSKADKGYVTKLNAAINAALKEQSIQDKLKRFGLESRIEDPDATAKFFSSEVDHWGKMVKAIGVSIN
jgi:tripartite-type tricarboxylate transporter receptor subunit TctC